MGNVTPFPMCLTYMKMNKTSQGSRLVEELMGMVTWPLLRDLRGTSVSMSHKYVFFQTFKFRKELN